MATGLLLSEAWTTICPDGTHDDESDRSSDAYLPNTFSFEVDESLSMQMSIIDDGRESNHVKNNKAEYKAFSKKFNLLSNEDLEKAVTIPERDFLNQLSALVPCVGCRKSAEKLYQYAKSENHDATFYPFIMNNDGDLQVYYDKRDRNEIYKLLYNQNGSMKELLKWFQKFSDFDKAKRCNYHSSEIQKGVKIFAAWIDVWNYMSESCRETASFVQEKAMQRLLDEYLHKNKFCCDCKRKVLRAYDLLIGKIDSTKEQGYLPQLYEGITYNPELKVIQIEPTECLMKDLMGRAVPELSKENDRERHAKTIDTAQEEVLTCIGICFLHRLTQIQQKFRIEERAYQLVLCIATSACRKQFEIAVDQKMGVDGLSWCDAMDKEAEAKRQKKALKKKKQRKSKKQANQPEEEEEQDSEDCKENREVETKNTQNLDKTVIEPLNHDVVNENLKKPKPLSSGNVSPLLNDNSQDCGYSSGNNIEHLSGKTTPYGSDTSCSEGLGFCNHGGTCNEDPKSGARKVTSVIKQENIPTDTKSFIEKSLRELKADENGIIIPEALSKIYGTKEWFDWREGNRKMLRDQWNEYWAERKRSREIRKVEPKNDDECVQTKVCCHEIVESKDEELFDQPEPEPKNDLKKTKVKRAPRDLRRYKGKNRH